MLATDEDLMKRIAEGDQGAFLDLYGRFAPRVYGLIVKVMGRRPEAEDVMQDVMWEAWTRAPRYDPSLGSPTTWLLLLARSRAIDAIRKLQVAHATALERARRHAADGVDGENPASFARVYEEGADHGLRAAMDDLPPDQCVVIMLAFFRGLTREQIAVSLGIPVGTVKTRIRLGVKRLSERDPQPQSRSGSPPRPMN